MDRSTFTRKLTTSLLVGLFTAFLAAAAIRSRPTTDPDRAPSSALVAGIERLELGMGGLLSSREAPPASADIAIVSLDGESATRSREMLGNWPWPRAALGGLAKELHELGARLVVLDNVFSDPADLKDEGGDLRLAALLERAGPAVAGVRFAEVSEQSSLNLGRWALLKGVFPTRAEALAAAAPMLVAGAAPFLVASAERVELWLGGYRDKAAALEEAERRREPFGLGKEPVARELGVEESLDKVSLESLFAEKNAVKVPRAQGHVLNTFMTLQPPVAPLLAGRLRFGSVSSLHVDEDGVVRGVRHLVKYEGLYYPSLALAAALQLSGEREVALEAGRLRGRGFGAPLDPFGVSLLRRYGAAAKDGEGTEGPYERIPAYAVARSQARREKGHGPDERLRSRIRGKVVFLAVDAGTSAERKPAGEPAFQRAAVFANALDNLLRGDGILRASTEYDSAVAALLALLGGLASALLTRSVRPARTVASQALAGALILGAFLSYAEHRYRAGLWIGMAVPSLAFLAALLASTLLNLWDEARTTSLVREALGHDTSPDLLDKILRNPRHLSMEGEQRVMTVFFADVNGFSSATEALKPQEMVKLLNEYLSEVTDAVSDFGGQIDKFVGDTAIAYWGAPVPNHLHAVEACRCAVRLCERLRKRRHSWKSRFGAEIQVRVGIHTGPMVVGNMGAQGVRRRVSYSVIGDAVNFASRLQAANKGYGTEILISDATFDEAREEIEAREVDLVRVKGRRNPARIFELMGMKGEVEEARAALARQFEDALRAYRGREFRLGAERFAALAKKQPGDGVTAAYLERCKACVEAPLGEEWDGVWGRRGDDGASCAKDPEPG